MIVVYTPKYKTFSFFRDQIKIEEFYSSYFNRSKEPEFTFKGKCKYGHQHIENGLDFISPYLGTDDYESTDLQYDNPYLKFFCDDLSKCKICKNIHGDKSYIVYEGDLNICFGKNCSIVFYKDLDYTPERTVVSFKTASKAAKELNKRWKFDWDLNKYSHFYKKDHYEFPIWKFKKETDYVVFHFERQTIYNFAPEIFNNGLDYMLSFFKYPLNDFNNYMYNLEPFNSSRDYNFEKERWDKIVAERERKAKEDRDYKIRIERQKLMDGYCDMCGQPDASYVANPYYIEMGGDVVMQWLCDYCYRQCQEDV